MSHPFESKKDENRQSLEVRYHNKTEKDMSAERKETSSPTIALPPSPEATEVAMRFLTSIYCDPPSPPSVFPSP
jgi:hypothetical protein